MNCSLTLICLQPTVNVKTAVSSYGMHVFVVQYYQPYNVGIDVKVDVQVDGQTHQGQSPHFSTRFCFVEFMVGPTIIFMFDN